MPRVATAVDAYIGAQMCNRRTDLGLSQADLGKKLGVTFQQIHQYESGYNCVSAARLFVTGKRPPPHEVSLVCDTAWHELIVGSDR
jgi:hypothetical protein